jgi:hypothetical protein
VYDGVFWGVALGLAAAGGRALVRQRRWDLLGLLGGLAVSLAGLHQVAGSAVLSTVFHRYGAFLVIPSAWAFAVLARPVVFTAGGPAPARPRRLAVAAGLAAAAFLLYDVRTRYFDFNNPTGAESYWTLGTETVGRFERAYRAIVEDIDRYGSPAPGRTCGLILEDWWVTKTIEYLASDRPDLKVVRYDELRLHVPFEPDLKAYLERRFRAGDYFVARPAPVVAFLRRKGPWFLPVSLEEDLQTFLRPDRDAPRFVGNGLVIHRARDARLAEGRADDRPGGRPAPGRGGPPCRAERCRDEEGSGQSP